ncbi:MAG: N-formylglutamate amidohydrolase [Proteobacteria bacterium]|nr:N-formylglutamate amidohydrolase [Pseudomonadota bacterium]
MEILSSADENPVGILRPDSRKKFFLTCDHASSSIPPALCDLGLSKNELQRHIGWDIGALGVAQEISKRLDATLVWQNYSRLVVDCNRVLKHPGLIPQQVEATSILGNINITEEERRQRISEFYNPYHLKIKRLLDTRTEEGLETIFISIHSFTPVYLGHQRPWDLGVLYSDDVAYSHSVLDRLSRETNLRIGDNEPYQIDEKDCTIPLHALKRGLRNTLFEIKQDLITSTAHQISWGKKLSQILVETA